MRAITVLTIILALGCGKAEEQVPPGVIPPDSMALMIAEMHLAEAAGNLGMTDREEKRISYDAFYNGALKKNKVSRERLDSSYHYYLNNPEKFSEIYERAVEILVEREGRN